MTTETVLTPACRQKIIDEHPVPGTPQVLDLIIAIEQAVLQSPEIQELRKDASLASEYRKLLEGASAVLANCADDMEDEGDEIGAHEARSMANVINDAMERQP